MVKLLKRLLQEKIKGVEIKTERNPFQTFCLKTAAHRLYEIQQHPEGRQGPIPEQACVCRTVHWDGLRGSLGNPPRQREGIQTHKTQEGHCLSSRVYSLPQTLCPGNIWFSVSSAGSVSSAENSSSSNEQQKKGKAYQLTELSSYYIRLPRHTLQRTNVLLCSLRTPAENDSVVQLCLRFLL